ncbi:MAG: peptidoglycan DD-metalloendopeptidase family protein [Archangiaceae bacterium]|nr:peptidoglycan DD-metalloendopeptidase family protein [Archangiaceae bacterium]
MTCDPSMVVFPVAAEHNIGYDPQSCTGGCAISCPDQHANSDWGGAHHGIDVFAFFRAPLQAVSDGVVVAVGVVSSTSGIRVRVRDACGWEYYYGHLDQAVVHAGEAVSAGQLLGYMGHTGTSATHLHFNVSPNGGYYNDINPLGLLVATSPTACQPPAPPPPPPPAGCGVLAAGEALGVDGARSSCDGRFNLLLQSDGNLVLYQDGATPLWASGTVGSGADTAVMQTDGNFVLYAGGAPVWHTWTFGHDGAVLAVQDDGNLVLYQGNTALWASGTAGH